MEILCHSAPLHEIKAEASLIFVINKEISHEWIADSELFGSGGFEGKEGQTLFIPQSKTLYYALDSLTPDSIRESSAKALRALKKYPFSSF